MEVYSICIYEYKPCKTSMRSGLHYGFSSLPNKTLPPQLFKPLRRSSRDATQPVAGAPVNERDTHRGGEMKQETAGEINGKSAGVGYERKN